MLIGGAAINRAFGYRTLYPGGKDSEEVYEPGVFYCKDAFEGLAVMDQLVDVRGARRARARSCSRGATSSAPRARRPRSSSNLADDSVRSAARTDVPIPTPPFWGVREIAVDLDEVYRHLDTHVLFKLHWGGRGVKGEAWQKLLRRRLPPAPGAHVARAGLPAPARAARLLPLLRARQRDHRARCPATGTPRPRSELTRFVCPRQPKGDRICLADFFRPAVDGEPPEELDVIAVQAVTVGSEVTELMAKLEAEGEFAEQLFVHGLGVQTAEGLAEWLHGARARCSASTPAQGRRYSWGYPAVPEQAEHLKVQKLLDLGQIGMTITDGYAPEPEQSTLALIAHHPQAIYFGTRQGRLLPDGSPDDVIRGSNRDPSLFGEIDDDDPPDGAVESEDEPAMAGDAS